MKRGKHLCVHICVCAQLRVLLLLVHQSVDASRRCLKAFLVSAAACWGVCQESIKTKVQIMFLWAEICWIYRKESTKPKKQEFSTGKCFFIKVLDECHRLQVRCCEITETLLFYYHFLHLQVKLWRWCIGIITEPLCQRKCVWYVHGTDLHTHSYFSQKKLLQFTFAQSNADIQIKPG